MSDENKKTSPAALATAEPHPPQSPRFKSTLEEYERSGDDRPPFILTYPELKLLGIAGVSIGLPCMRGRTILTVVIQVGFFLDGAHLCLVEAHIAHR